ncbi:MAG: pilus assembly protein [Alphaproteobacteria bacterium]|nr:pilus assembly protein [Alphaproteobacteria bacterium]
MKTLVKDNDSGVAALEAALTFPVIIILIFFILEMLRVNDTRTAMNSMALEATLDFIANQDASKFPTIIAKHKPKAIPTANIKYYFTIYESLEKMCSVPPYGSEEVFWPDGTSYSPDGTKVYVDSNRDNAYLGRNVTTSSSGYINLTNTSNPTSTTSLNTTEKISGKVFVLTFVCDFVFSSDFVKKLFAGGSNTVNGKRFLIWGRGVGVCD